MHIARLQLGSNTDTRREKLAQALDILSRNFRVLKISIIVESPDVNGGVTIYANQLVDIETDLSVDQLQKRLKQIEGIFGERILHAGDTPNYIPVDIDLLIFGSLPLKPADLNRPYYRTILAQGF